jgi:hypothetical protein
MTVFGIPIVAAKDARSHRPGGVKLQAFFANSPLRSLLAAAVTIVILVGGAFWLLRHVSKTHPNSEDLTRRQEIEIEVHRLNPPSGQPLPPELTAPAAHILSVTLNPNILSRSNGELAKFELLNNVAIV